MSITRAFNKHTGVYYAYDVQYVWSEEAQKKVPVRKCIGKFDPETNQIIPNGKRGPKPVRDIPKAEPEPDVLENPASLGDNGKVADSELANVISGGFRQLNGTLQEMMGYIKNIAALSQASESCHYNSSAERVGG